MNALIAKVRGAPDAFTLKCEGTNDDFYFTVSASFDAVVWSGGKNIEQRSIFADGKDTGLGSKAKVRVEPNVISWNVKTAYGRDFGTIDRKKLTLDMHATIDGDDIFNVGPCTQN